ncbi:MAG: transporter substrate-binding domain-containing protein [Pseudomonadota bacterium]
MGLYKNLLAAWLLCSTPVPGLAADAAPARVKVVVATDSWGQLMYLDKKNVPSGVLADFVNKMNVVQDKFGFELVIYPRLRVDSAFIAKEADVYPLRTMAWTKPALNLLPTKTILTSGDVYFARRNNRFGGAKVFQNLREKNIAGVRGYHYELFDNNPDEAYLRKHFKVYLFGGNEQVVRFVVGDRADVGIVPEVILARYLEDPKMRAQIIVGPEPDSVVELSNLVRRDGPISVEQMNAIVDLLVKSGDVARLKLKLSIERDQSRRK